MYHDGHLSRLGQGPITGHQNRNPATRKDTCSASCQPADCIPSSNRAGTCHPITADVETSQQNTGCVTMRPSFRAGERRRSRPRTLRTKPCGLPCSSTLAGAPSKINGAATVMRRRCCTIWIVRSWWSRVARGDAAAAHSKQTPLMKAARRHRDSRFGRTLRN